MANDKLREALRDIVREVIAETFQAATQQAQQGEEDFGPNDEGYEEAKEEAEERDVPISQTRAYRRQKGREFRGREVGEEEGGSIRQRGRVTDPDHDRRLKGNREAA